MNKIFNFQSFLESVSSGKSQLLFSERFRNLIGKISDSKDPVAQLLKQSENQENFKDDITFIDITDKEDMVSFIQVNRLDRLRQGDRNFYKKILYYGSDKYDLTPIPELDKYIQRVWKATQKNLEHDSWKKQRTEIGVGRFVNRISSLQSITVKSEQLEKFVNSYKAHWKQLNNIEDKFELVSGEEIRSWYLVDNYQEKKGQLYSSCMRYIYCQPFFDIYTLNTEVCQLLILKGKDPDKISGRSLVWKTVSGETYMDRPYINNDSDMELFENYAKKNGWLYYYENISKNLEVKVKNIDYEYFPYMDSFRVYNTKTGILSTNERLWPSQEWWKLENTDGGYKTGDVVFSKTIEDFVSRELVVWVEDLQDYIWSDEAVYVESEDSYFSEENDDIIYCSWADVYEFEQRCVYSKFIGGYLIKKDSHKVWTSSKIEDWLPKINKFKAIQVKIYDKEKLCLVESIEQDEDGNWQFKN